PGRASQADIVRIISNSPEHHAYEVQGIYQQYLHRSADAAGLQSFVQHLGQGATVERRPSLSPPRSTIVRGGDTVAGFLTALYQDTLLRAPDAATSSPLANSQTRSV